MIEMRSEQFEVFERQSLLEFQQRAIAQLREGMPEETAGMSDETLRTRLQSAAERSALYELETEIEILYFLNSAILIGDDQFDVNPSYPWAAEILEGDLDLDEKAEAVFNAAFAEYESRQGVNGGT